MVFIQTYLWQKSHLSFKWVAGNVFFQSYDDVMWIKTSITHSSGWSPWIWIIQLTHWIENDSSLNYSTNKERAYSYDVADSPKLILEKTPKNIEILFPPKIIRTRVYRTGRYFKRSPNKAFGILKTRIFLNCILLAFFYLDAIVKIEL